MSNYLTGRPGCLYQLQHLSASAHSLFSSNEKPAFNNNNWLQRCCFWPHKTEHTFLCTCRQPCTCVCFDSPGSAHSKDYINLEEDKRQTNTVKDRFHAQSFKTWLLAHIDFFLLLTCERLHQTYFEKPFCFRVRKTVIYPLLNKLTTIDSKI